jgi:quercetin dioxygenase-like cupin family protein
MKILDTPFGITDWSRVDATTHPGDTGVATWRTLTLGEIRVRMVEYSPGYVADHWCSKGHIVLCLAGELVTTLADGRTFTLRPGQSYQVGDDTAPHRSSTADGATIFIVD